MFEPAAAPRIFGLPPGADFPAELTLGILSRLSGQPPEALARVTLLVNTRRMQRRLKELFAEGQARLLPRILLVTDLDPLLPGASLPPPVTPLRRRLELSALVAKLIETSPGIAPPSAAIDLADSLAALMDEMQGEGVSTDVLLSLDLGEQSEHWQRSLGFIAIVSRYLADSSGLWLDVEARRRRGAELLVESWQKEPPGSPVIVAGSTGSRATTALIMQAVARLPQGAVVLPGFDFDLPDDIFAGLTGRAYAPLGSEDHPQYRFANLLKALGLSKSGVAQWGAPQHPQNRNALISLSLRPAPATDQWLTEGPALGNLSNRTMGVTLIEAPQVRDEALAIAVALRVAVENGQTAALITPDRTLGRRVAASLARWDIVPDDSAGQPLSLTPPGRFLRQVAGIIGHEADPVDLVALLKHPLARSAEADRGPHLLLTHEFELFLRRRKVAVMSPEAIAAFARDRSVADQHWCAWLSNWLASVGTLPRTTLAAALDHHVTAAEALAAGQDGGSGQLWEQTAGRDALTLIDRFRAESDFSGPLPFAEYTRLLDQALAAESTRNHDSARTDVMIWGTLEARVQGADLVILGGLNEGVWPEQPAPDPWLNRPLRRQAGLLLPDRQVGLSAHDYQQAVAARQVILSRAKRDEASETVPSRWLSRLINLLEGLKDREGPQAVASMRARGQSYLDMARQLDQPDRRIDAMPRPAPAPPRDVRPVDLTVTEIQNLIRDPYSIYARHVLNLRPLDPLRVQPDARIRGIVFHDIVEEAFGLDADFSDPIRAAEDLRQTGRRHFTALPWPGVAAHWSGHLDAIADQLVLDEQRRRLTGRPLALEVKGRIDIPGTRFSVRGKADRIDRLADGRLVVYDYKTGTPPTPEALRYFNRQLPIEAVMAELGGFEDILATPVSHVTHIGLGRTPKLQETPLTETEKIDLRTETIAAELARLLSSFDSETKGYPSRRAMEKVGFDGDYDHLARFGEWDETSPPITERLP